MKMNEAEARELFQYLFIAELYRKKQSQSLVFKGGTLLALCVYPSFRFSEDIDFDIEGAVNNKTKRLFSDAAKRMSKIASKSVRGEVSLDIDKHGVPDMLNWSIDGMNGKIQIDFTEHQNIETLDVIENWRLLPNRHVEIASPFIVGYSIEQVVSTKFRCVSQRFRGRDIFDLWQIAVLSPSDFRQGCDRYERTWASMRNVFPPDKIKNQLIFADYNYSEEWEADKNEGLIPSHADFSEAFETLLKKIPF